MPEVKASDSTAAAVGPNVTPNEASTGMSFRPVCSIDCRQAVLGSGAVSSPILHAQTASAHNANYG